jgi:hypothetical protein
MVSPRMAAPIAVCVSSLFVLGFGGSPKEKQNSLDTVAWRAAQALRHGDWDAFHKDAAPVLIIEERWLAYDMYFTKDVSIRKPVLGAGDELMLSHVTRIVADKISAKGRSVFDKLSRIVRDSWSEENMSRRPSLVRHWEVKGMESVDVSGPAITSTVASNVDWAVEFEQVQGQWKARRLLLLGH